MYTSNENPKVNSTNNYRFLFDRYFSKKVTTYREYLVVNYPSSYRVVAP